MIVMPNGNMVPFLYRFFQLYIPDQKLLVCICVDFMNQTNKYGHVGIHKREVFLKTMILKKMSIMKPLFL